MSRPLITWHLDENGERIYSVTGLRQCDLIAMRTVYGVGSITTERLIDTYEDQLVHDDDALHAAIMGTRPSPLARWRETKDMIDDLLGKIELHVGRQPGT